MFRLTRFIIICTVLTLNLAFAVPTFACQFSWIPIEERLDDAPIVLVGTITDTVIVSPEDGLITMQVVVETYLQGEGLAVVTVEGYHGKFPCDDIPAYPSVGERIIFFVNGTGETLHTQYYDGWNNVYPTYDDVLSDVEAYIADPFRPIYRVERQLEKWRFAAPFHYVQQGISYWIQSVGSTVLIVVSLVLVDGLMVMLVVRRWITYNRKAPTKRG